MSKHELPNQEPLFEVIDFRELNSGSSEFSLDDYTLAEDGEKRPLDVLEYNLKHEIVGQDEAIESLIRALYRENFRNPNRPITVLMLLGPTGVGKTETAKALAKYLHGSENEMVRINCSEISENHRVSVLLGASPEYVGREQEPLLDRKRIERDRSIVLFDEVEKGAPALHNLLLQICDEGQVTLLKDGKPVSFRNSIIILTSNIGAEDIMKLTKPIQTGFQKDQSSIPSRAAIKNAALKRLVGGHVFRPELINRIDQKIVYGPLDDLQFEEVLGRYINNANYEYHKKGLHLEVSPELMRQIVLSCNEEGDNRRVFGARPIINKFRDVVESEVARKFATGGIVAGSQVYATIDGDGGDLQSSLRIYHKRSNGIALAKSSNEKSGHLQQKSKESDTAVFDKGAVIGAAALAGVVALAFSDYRRNRRRHA